MAGKRQATSELNHDNWDREEEPEERGTFRTATEVELKNRVIKKAKRKLAAGDDTADGGTGTKNVFSGFSGFGTSSGPTTSSPFSFLNKIPALATATSVVSSSSTTITASSKFSFGSDPAAKTSGISDTSFSFKKSVDNVVPPEQKRLETSSANSDFSEYLKKVCSLNQAVSEWIKIHVEKNPVCILSPIFKDYEKYLGEIENDRENKLAKKANTVTGESAEKTSSPATAGNFKISTIPINTSETLIKSKTESKTNGFSFDVKKTEDILLTKPPTTSSFSFNLKPTNVLTTATTSSTTSDFSFGILPNNSNQSSSKPKPFSFAAGGTPFSFGNIKPPESVPNATESEQNEEVEEPPKNEFKQVVEEDAIYSKKCKVFVKKDGNFVDKGVGTLHLKPVKSSGKTQLLVRADTNLGNILVNLILSTAIPTQRMGKNNVMMICLPTPDEEKPTSMLLRVKTGEEADELLENIDKNKN